MVPWWSQITSGQLTLSQVGYTSTRMIDEHYGKWITEDAPGMAQFVSERLSMISGDLVPPRSQNAIESEIKSIKSDSYLAVREGFEPSIRYRIHAFQACAFDHSATSP